MSAPTLPARKRLDRSRTGVKNAPIKAATAIQELQKAAASTAEKLQEQESVIRQTLQEEPILQQAVASNPELAQLLQPEKLQQLLSAMKSPSELQQFFESHPELQDLTKHRQTVMSLRQQLQTLRQQQVRNFMPQASQENMQAARQILSQFMQVNPSMTVSQLRPQWPGQHLMPQAPNPHSFRPTSHPHGPPPLPPPTHDHSPISPLLQNHTPVAPSTHTNTPPSSHQQGSPQDAVQLHNGLLLPGSTKHGTATTEAELADVHTVREVYSRGRMGPSHTSEVVPDSHSHWQQPSSRGGDHHHSHTWPADGHHHTGSITNQPHYYNPWNPPETHAGSHSAAPWVGERGPERDVYGTYDSYSQFFNNTYQIVEGGQQNEQGGAAEPAARRLDPKYHYEQVEPSDWKPPPAENCLRLYSRAYLGPMDVLFPPLWFALSMCLCALKSVPLWALFLILPVMFVGGMELLVVQGAGVSRKKLAVSKTVPSFVVSCEVAALLVVVTRMIPLMLYAGTWQAVQVLLLTGSVLAVMLLHWWAATSDPGYLDTAKDEQADSSESSVREPLNPTHVMPECWTCRIPRPLRSKHCSVCQRCVSRFDHHCNMLPNCVGAGNQALFASFLFTMLMALFFFFSLSWKYSWLRFAAASEQMSADSKWPTWLLVLQSTSVEARDFFFLQLLFVPITAGVLFLSTRCVFLIIGNLTTNELLNRHRYIYLRHELAGFCNRFDWGPVRNFLQFWGKQKGLDWWKEFEAGDKAMQSKSMTMITTWSATYYIRLWDLKYQQVKERLYRLREEKREQRLQRAMMRLHADMD